MQIFARIVDGTVRELLPVPDNLVIGRDLYAPEVAAACVPCDAAVEVGWLYDGAAFKPPAVTVAELLAYAAAKRFAVESGGIVVGGATIATDRDSQGMIGNAFAYVTTSGADSVRFKAASGWVSLSGDQVRAMALAVGAHVQASFKVEDDLDAAIKASPPAVTTFAQIDTAPWPANA